MTARHSDPFFGQPPPTPRTISTGISGLDEILGGGLPAGHMYLITGNAGSGKTTLALQFLLEGRARGERVLYVSLSETITEIDGIARSHGWSLDGVNLQDVVADQHGADENEQTVFKASEVELGEFRARLEAAVEQANPERVVLDSISELRLLSGDSRQHHKQIAALKRYFGKRGCTLLITDDNTGTQPETLLHSVAHGVIALNRVSREFGGSRQQLEVVKVRGLAFSDGLHDYAIRTGGLLVYPRLIAAAYCKQVSAELISSGLPALDALLGGGIHRGTSVALIGTSGIGKSTTALQYVVHGLTRGAKSSIFLFDESPRTLQLNAVGAKLSAHIATDQVSVDQIDPAELSPGEFTAHVRYRVERGAEIVVIDGLNGYLNAMPGEQFLSLHLHELLTYLNASNVATFLIVNQPGALVPDVALGLDVSYLTDTVILYRNYELDGEVRRALSVLKHRGAALERTLRELKLTGEGILIGERLRDLRGVLTGTPWMNAAHEPPKQ